MRPFPSEEAPGISVFYKDDAGEVFHTYSTYGRGVEVMMGTYNMLDLTPKGRDERDVAYKMEWVRHHDRYEPARGTSRRLRPVRAATRTPEARAASSRMHVMASLWPWLAVAGLGALHGLNPATGWMFAAAWGVRSRDRAQALRALVPIAVGHAASVALVAAAVAFGLSMDRVVLQALAGGLLVVAAIVHLSGRTPRRRARRPGTPGWRSGPS